MELGWPGARIHYALQNSEAKPAYPISSVDNALRLLLLFRERELVRVSDAAQILGVGASTAHRLLTALQHRGFAIQDDLTRAYRAGPALHQVGLAVSMELRDLRSQAEPIMEALCEKVGETVHLVQLRGTEVQVIFGVEPDRSLRVNQRAGQRMPAHATASGKSLLAWLTRERVRQLYPQQRLPIETKTTIDTRSALEEELELIRQRGFALAVGETEDEVSSISTAVVGQAGWPRGALTITIPTSRFDKAAVPDLARQLVAAAKELGDLLP